MKLAGISTSEYHSVMILCGIGMLYAWPVYYIQATIYQWVVTVPVSIYSKNHDFHCSVMIIPLLVLQ